MCQHHTEEIEQLELELEEEESEDMVECYHCDEYVTEDEITEVDDHGYCESCLDDISDECSECSDRHLHENMRRVNGEYYCESCNEEVVRDCCHCGTERHEEEMEEASNGDYYCERCANRRLHTCDRCGERKDIDDVHRDSDNDTVICRSCYDRYDYRRCFDCECILRERDQIYRESYGETYCESCDPGDDNDDESDVISDYGYKPSPRFHTFENDIDSNLFLGVEIEMDKGGYNHSNARTLMSLANRDHHEHIYIKSDSSINNGFEVVSHPATLEYHMKCLAWKDVLSEAARMGYRSHQVETCGLHVHISRLFFGDEADTQDLNLMKFLYFVEKFWEQIKKFSRRTDSQIGSWANRYGLREDETPEQLLTKAKNDRARYRAINLTVSKTVEFRIFRGTLKYNSFIATLQFVALLARFSKNCTIEDVLGVTWEDMVHHMQEYPELATYLQERGLGGAVNE